MTQPVWQYLSAINSMSGDIAVTIAALNGGSTPGNTVVWTAANEALFVPFVLHQGVVVKRLWAANGNTVSGNIDVGIYSMDARLIRSSGSTVQATANALQFFDITDFYLGPGVYYIATALDNITAILFRSSVSAVLEKAVGMAKMASAFPLPATATLATVTAAHLPIIGAEIADLT